jgi:hypothetical protein
MEHRIMKVLPTMCPACNSQLNVKSLICERCQTEIQGQYELPLLSRLSNEDQGFMLEFIKASGSLKEMAKLLGLSYPTVRNRLDEIIERIKLTEKEGKEKKL